MKCKSIVGLFVPLVLLMTSCGYRIALESTDTTATTTTSLPKLTPTTIDLGDGCTSANHAVLLTMRGDITRTRNASTDGDGFPTRDEWQAETLALRSYRSFVRSLDVPTLSSLQNVLVDAIADFLEAYNRYWESGKQDLSVNNYITPYSDADFDFWRAFEKACR